MNIPFSPPYIDDDVIKEVVDTLQSGWITSGPKVKALEKLTADLLNVEKAVCVNSWTSGALLVMKWLGIGEGDEVIVPAYTYSATALSVLHTGAKPVMVDIREDFTIDPEKIKAAITSKTKAVLCVDIGGLPCDYDAINNILKSEAVNQQFKASNDIQAKFGRPLLIADAAHSFGASYNGKSSALSQDITIISLHAVKNITTAEGGVICLNLPKPFDNAEVYDWMKLNSLNGQTADALTKSISGSWKYDIVSLGLKINLTDVCAAIGLAQMRKYDSKLLPNRKRIYNHYTDFFKNKPWAIIPPVIDDKRESSYHLYLLRIKGITEAQRDEMIKLISTSGASVNVHFTPMPMLTLFKGLGYKIEDYSVTYSNYANEISLPVYVQLTDEQCTFIEEQIELAYNTVIK
ncbi:MAG: DegT/DnrJ/EryC1/StrS family aminotransferase [Bacteroidetes bacterium]|nr:DegT/DnrJ/EryC1/StrS family aminotransferase [Bacteroidota bacterium]